MDTSFIQLSAQSLVLVPIVMACVSLIKMYVNSYWSPLFAVVLGVAGAFLFPSATAGVTILDGLVIGLTAAGLYSSGAKMIQG